MRLAIGERSHRGKHHDKPVAMTALQTLSEPSTRILETTQSRISTGFRVAEGGRQTPRTGQIANHDALRQQPPCRPSTDSLGLGAWAVGRGLTNALDVVKRDARQSQGKLVTAQGQPDLERSKIQSEIEQLQNNLKTYAESAPSRRATG